AVGAVGPQLLLAGPAVARALERSRVAPALLIDLGADVGDGPSGPALGSHPLNRITGRDRRGDRHLGLAARGGPELASVPLLAGVALARDRPTGADGVHDARPSSVTGYGSHPA